ncbi:MAG: hypothetical protein ACTSO8_07685 [Promethearchaeota archaeon]
MEENTKIFELESELYALVNTIKNLWGKYQENTINENFFRKALRNAVKGLLNINISLKEKGLLLSKVLKDMDFVKEYNNAVRTIDKILIINPHKENFEFLDENHSHFSKSIKSSILELPGITSEITTSFITLMDALKLEGLRNSDLIMKLLKELKLSLKNFPGIDDITLKIDKIKSHASENTNLLIENRVYREKLVDHLYEVFNEFQNKINLKM